MSEAQQRSPPQGPRKDGQASPYLAGAREKRGAGCANGPHWQKIPRCHGGFGKGLDALRLVLWVDAKADYETTLPFG